jgi:N-acylneuraminate cytidylyltransferase
VRHAIDSFGGSERTIVILYANVPVRPAGLIDHAVCLLHDTGADSVQSYCDVGKHHPYWMVALDDARRVIAHHPNTVYRRQDLPKLMIPDGGVIAVTRDSLFDVVEGEPHAFLGKDRRGVETEPGAVIDVDSPIDLALAEASLAALAPETTA